MSFLDKIKGLCFFLVLFWLWSCDAPRNNPLDPANENSSLSALSGNVLTYRVPHQPISGVKVTWENENRFAYTNNSGHFSFSDISQTPGWLFFETQAFLYDSIFVDWKTTKSGFDKYLNARPMLQSKLFYSSIRNRYPDRKIINLNLKVDIADPDNDIDSVLVECGSLNVNTFLNYDLGNKVYQRSLTMADLNIGQVDAVIGHVFGIYVKDNLKNKILVTEEIVKRIVKEEVITRSPDSGDTLSLTPTLNWEPIDPGFPFMFMVEIYLDDINPPLIWSKGEISSGTTSISVDTPLEENRYFWVVWVIDEFQNRSASKPKTFYAKNP